MRARFFCFVFVSRISLGSLSRILNHLVIFAARPFPARVERMEKKRMIDFPVPPRLVSSALTMENDYSPVIVLLCSLLGQQKPRNSDR